MGPREIHKDSIISNVNIIWTTIKIVLILFIFFPFMDKIRHKNYFSKAIDLIIDLDIGCRPCLCPNNTFNTTLREGDKGASGF